MLIALNAPGPHGVFQWSFVWKILSTGVLSLDGVFPYGAAPGSIMDR